VHLVLDNKVANKEVLEVLKEVLEDHKEVLEVHMEVLEDHKEVHLEEEAHKEVLEVHMVVLEVHKEAHLEEEVLEVHKEVLEVLAAHMVVLEVHKEVHMVALEVHKEVHKVPMEVHKAVMVLAHKEEEEDHHLKVAHMDLILPLVVEARHKEEEDIKIFLIFYLIPYYVLMKTVVNIVIR